MKKLFCARKWMAVLCLLPLLLLVACGPAETRGAAMDTYYGLRLYEGSQELINDMTARLEQVDFYLDAHREGSDIARINAAPTQDVTLSQDAAAVLAIAQDLYTRTGGVFSPYLWPLIQAWNIKDDTDQPAWQPPDQWAIDAAMAACNPPARLDAQALQLSREGAGVDLGAIAKGYMVDVWRDMARADGVESAMMDMGGTICVMGPKPDGTPWKVGLQDPNGGLGQNYAIMEMTDACVSTSGDYVRFQTYQDQRYGHIIDPRTGAPANAGLVSVSVIGPSGAVCDALSTALFVLGREEGFALLAQFEGYRVVAVDKGKTIHLSHADMVENFTVHNTAYTLA